MINLFIRQDDPPEGEAGKEEKENENGEPKAKPETDETE